MTPKQIAEDYFSKNTKMSPTEKDFRRAIESGEITTGMSLKKMGQAIGVANPGHIRYYLLKFLREESNHGK